MRLTFLPIAAALFVTPATAQTTAPADSLTTDTTAIDDSSTVSFSVAVSLI